MLEKNTGNNNIDGLVWIKDGKVFVKNKSSHGMPPVINPCTGVKLFINNIEYNHLTTVSEADSIELKPLDVKTGEKFEIELTEDKLKCYLIFTPARLIRHVIEDSGPGNRLDIKASQIVLETMETDPEQVLNFLKSANIVYGIKTDILEKICKDNKPGRFLVAEGQKAEDATDDRIECLFNEDEHQEFNPCVDELGNIDYKNIIRYNTVTCGQAIARLIKGKPGQEGMTVTGEPIVPQMPEELAVITNSSAVYDEETGEIKALKTGRPSMQKKGRAVSFQIYDSVVLDEVSIQTGNIRFRGDIEIKTNVFESMEVIAWQNILVRGNVNFASIYVGNNITIKCAAISSRINAALNNAVIRNPVPLIEKLYDGINNLLRTINQFPVNSMKKEQINYLIKKLLNTKNKDLPPLIYEVIQSLRKGNYDIEDDFVLELMKKTRPLMGNISEIPDLDYLSQLLSELKMHTSEDRSMYIKGDVVLGTATNCDIEALGNVTVLGRGCVNTNIYCKGKAEVMGYVRGGQIRAEKGIDINVAGSKRGSKILLSVPGDSYIKIRSVFTDTTVKVGAFSHTFYTNKTMVYARLENNKLLL